MNPENDVGVVTEETNPVLADTNQDVQSEPIENQQHVPEDKPVEKVNDKDEDDLPYGVKKRLGTLTRRNKEYELTIEQLRQNQAQMMERLEQITRATQKPVTRESFNNEDEYIAYVAEQKARELYHKQIVEPQQYHENAVREQQRIMEDWNARIAESFDDVNEYKASVGSMKVDAVPEVLNAIMESDEGPRIAYYLSKNPSEAEKIFSLKGKKLEKEMLKLELKLENQQLQQKATPSKSVTRAPSPVGKPADMPLTNKPESTKDWAQKFYKSYYGS